MSEAYLPHLEQRVHESYDWLQSHRTAYEEAKASMTQDAVTSLLQEWLPLVSSYAADDPPHKAVYILAQLQASAQLWLKRHELIQKYEKINHERALMLQTLNGVEHGR